MARAIWNGIISFGLLNIPISLYAAEKRVDLHFRMIDSRSKKPIRYERVNAETGEEVPWKDIVQAFEYQKGNYVVLSKEDLAAVAPKGKESIDIESFVERTAIPVEFYEKPYYLVPGKKAEKGYALLREILQKTHRAGIGYVMIRTRRYLSAVLASGDALILMLLRFPQELVGLDEFIFPDNDLQKLRISKRELEMAEELVDSMTEIWKPANYVDDYRQKLTKVVEQRLAKKQGLVHEQPGEQPDTDAATNVVDFMALLKQSLQKKDKAASKSTGGTAGKPTAAKGTAKGNAKAKQDRAGSASAKKITRAAPKRAAKR